MVHPPSGENTAIQLNMGEGKSSVIVPVVASTLADRKKLVRVVVLKPLSRQMFDLLRQRLSGLCNRRIYYIPFSRQIPVGNEEIRLIQQLYQQCMDSGGILVTLPEHILSLKLMTVDRTITTSTTTKVQLRTCGVSSSLARTPARGPTTTVLALASSSQRTSQEQRVQRRRLLRPSSSSV